MNGKEKQILYSKSQIIQATFKLLEKNTFDELTINEILDESQISRRTFYRHFKNKQSIIKTYCQSLVEDYFSLEQTIIEQSSFNRMIGVTFSYFKKHQPQLRLLIKNQLFHLLQDEFNQLALDLYQTIRAPWHISTENTASLKTISYFIVGGYFNILQDWLMQDDPQEITDISQDIATLFTTCASYFDN